MSFSMPVNGKVFCEALSLSVEGTYHVFTIVRYWVIKQFSIVLEPVLIDLINQLLFTQVCILLSINVASKLPSNPSAVIIKFPRVSEIPILS